jgi:hypothetical protein
MQREEHIRMLIKQKSESVRPVRLNPIRRQKKHFFIEESESNWAVSSVAASNASTGRRLTSVSAGALLAGKCAPSGSPTNRVATTYPHI